MEEGKLEFVNGAKFKGDFIKDKIYGLGEFTTKDHFVFKGYYVENKYITFFNDYNTLRLIASNDNLEAQKKMFNEYLEDHPMIK